MTYQDPVCGMMIDENKTKYKSNVNGKSVYFCRAQCKDEFDRNPAKYQ
jgi:YHS domain-containing protein